MHRVEPGVFLVAATQIAEDGLASYLRHIRAVNWKSDAQTTVEEIVEVMARGCYKSFGTELNANLSRTREHNDEYLANILQQGHGAVLEHAWVSFMFCDVSRVFTHELVRHRVGTAISQESLRFVRMDDMGLWVPPCFQGNAVAEAIMEQAWSFSEARYHDLLAAAACIETGNPTATISDFNRLPFEVKKRYTSAARRVAPEGLATNIGWSCNMRTLRHVIELRTSPVAEEEIRFVFGQVAEMASLCWPNLFSDYQVEMTGNLPWYRTSHAKV